MLARAAGACPRLCSPLRAIGAARFLNRACGIVGMPNVGKSTLFNALTQTQRAEAANYPFCTIQPNSAKVAVRDERLDTLARIAGSERVVRSQLEFVDIAGLVRGASDGAGLGNQFLDNIRNVSAILHAVRCFEDEDVLHVENSVDPLRDLDIIRSELLLADLQTLERRRAALAKKRGAGDAKRQLEAVDALTAAMEDGALASQVKLPAELAPLAADLRLLTSKPVLYLCHVDEDDAAGGNELSARVQRRVEEEESARCVLVSPRLELEAAAMEGEGQMEYLELAGMQETGLARVVRECAHLLSLRSFFTAGPAESRSWTIHHGTRAPQAAGVIHSDFEKHFIRAETVSYDDYVACGGEKAARDAGKLRVEGKDYEVRDGDVVHFLTSA